MKKTSRLLLLALGLACSAGIQDGVAQQAPADGTWSLQEAVAYALKNNLQARQSLMNQNLNAVDLRQSKFNRLPSINGGGNYNYNSGSYQDPVTFSLVNESSQTSNFSINGSIPLFMGFQQLNTIKQNELELQASEQNALAVQNDITLQIVTAYLNILFADELIKTSTLQRDLTNQQLKRNRILFDAGSVAENTVLELESQFASDEVAIINAQNQRDISRVNLMQMLNIPVGQGFEIEIPEIPEPDQSPVLMNGDQVYDVAVQTQPAIKAADLRLLSAGKGLDIARGTYYPRLSIVGGVSSRYSSTSRFLTGRSTVDNGFLKYEFYEDEQGIEPKQTVFLPSVINTPVYGDYPFFDQIGDNIYKQVGVQLNVPILNGLQARSNVQRAKIAQENAKLDADIARNNLRQTIEQAYVDALAAQRKYVAAREQLRAAEKNYRNAELRLNNGVINTVDFNVIANSFRSAQSSLLQAKYEFTFKQKVLDFYQGKDISF
ncbi:TolC family protein [uncultured Pontibacter sp.]|uniref:TolC family protein n=1 Tax=uncultured Pontibacter sp. TaxID=453356 RepID=UPI0026078201|nr:TolC family protein [uncultured Pontibacter sp.]